MKNLLSLLVLSVCCISIAHQSCTVPYKDAIVDADYSNDYDKTSVQNNQYNTHLVDVLRKKHTVEIIGSGPRAHAIVRGIQSINDIPYPVYYVDNVRVGRNLPQVAGLVDASRVKRIEVISGLSELAAYGHDGRNGVIKIYTTKS